MTAEGTSCTPIETVKYHEKSVIREGMGWMGRGSTSQLRGTALFRILQVRAQITQFPSKDPNNPFFFLRGRLFWRSKMEEVREEEAL